MFQGQQGGVTHIKFSPDGNKLFTGGRKVSGRFKISSIVRSFIVTSCCCISHCLEFHLLQSQLQFTRSEVKAVLIQLIVIEIEMSINRNTSIQLIEIKIEIEIESIIELTPVSVSSLGEQQCPYIDIKQHLIKLMMRVA